MATIKAELKRMAKLLPKEKRQQILDMLRTPMSFSEIAEHVQVSAREVHGVLILNTYTIEMIRRESL